MSSKLLPRTLPDVELPLGFTREDAQELFACVWDAAPTPSVDHEAVRLAREIIAEEGNTPLGHSNRYKTLRLARALIALLPGDAEKCGLPAASFIPRQGLSFSCVLPKGHEGEHQQGGTCFKHGAYVGRQCPSFPDCVLGDAAGWDHDAFVAQCVDAAGNEIGGPGDEPHGPESAAPTADAGGEGLKAPKGES